MGPCIVSSRGGIPRVIEGPCIVSPRGGIPRVIEGPCMKIKRKLLGMAGFVLKGISPGNHPFGNLEQFHREIILSGFYPSVGDSLYWKPNRRLLRDFLSLSLYDAQEKAKLNEEFF